MSYYRRGPAPNFWYLALAVIFWYAVIKTAVGG